MKNNIKVSYISFFKAAHAAYNAVEESFYRNRDESLFDRALVWGTYGEDFDLANAAHEAAWDVTEKWLLVSRVMEAAGVSIIDIEELSQIIWDLSSATGSRWYERAWEEARKLDDKLYELFG